MGALVQLVYLEGLVIVEMMVAQVVLEPLDLKEELGALVLQVEMGHLAVRVVLEGQEEQDLQVLQD